MRTLALAIALLATFETGSLAQNAQLIPLFVDVSSGDMVGDQIAYYLKQDIMRSSQYHLVYDFNTSSFTIYLATIDENRDDPGISSAYAAALVLSRTGTFVTQWVGTCGAERVQECAAILLADFSNQVDALRTKN